MNEERRNPIMKLFEKKEEVPNAEKAWIESRYGEGNYTPIESRVREKQEYIKFLIKGKSLMVGPNGKSNYSAYHCVVDIEADLISEIDTIFRPFRDGGFQIINLSEQVREIDEEHVYLISWKNVFSRKNSGEDRTDKAPTLIEE